jgi:peptidoglycan/LPS O-acetylase OafA/YrhL
MTHYKFIDSLRAFAAFWVLVSHCMIWGGWYGLHVPDPKIAVDLFMLISGFLMAANAASRWGIEPLTDPTARYRFWLRRYFRLAPAYYLSLLLAVVTGSGFLRGYQVLRACSLWTGNSVLDPSMVHYSLENILLHLTFTFGLYPTWSFSTFLPDWSLSLEMQYYLAFPFLHGLMSRYGPVRTSVVLSSASLAMGAAVTRFAPYPDPSLLLFKLPCFLSGMLIFFSLGTGILPRNRTVLSACAVALALSDMRFRHGKQLFILPLLVLAMLQLGWWEKTKRTPGWLSGLLRSRIIQFASDTSYSVYLFHGFFISATGLLLARYSWLSDLTPQHRVGVMLAFVSVGSYLLSYLVFHFVERRGILLGKLVLKRFVAMPGVPIAGEKKTTNFQLTVVQ